MGMFACENELRWTGSETKGITFLSIIGEKDIREVTQEERDPGRGALNPRRGQERRPSRMARGWNLKDKWSRRSCESWERPMDS